MYAIRSYYGIPTDSWNPGTLDPFYSKNPSPQKINIPRTTDPQIDFTFQAKMKTGIAASTSWG